MDNVDIERPALCMLTRILGFLLLWYNTLTSDVVEEVTEKLAFELLSEVVLVALREQLGGVREAGDRDRFLLERLMLGRNVVHFFLAMVGGGWVVGVVASVEGFWRGCEGKKASSDDAVCESSGVGWDQMTREVEKFSSRQR